MTRRLTNEELQVAVDALTEHGSQNKAAAALKLSRQALQNRLNIAAERGLMGFAPVLPGFRVSRSAVEQDGDGHTTRKWIEQKPERGDVFKVPDGHAIKGISALVDPEGREIAKWVKTREDSSTVDLVTAIRAAFEGYEPAPAIRAPEACDDDLLTTYPLPDLHLGMHAWGRETGESYDLKIASDRARSMAGALIAQSRPSRQALVLGLGDLFHMNDQKNMTPRSGHILDVDGRWPKVLATGVRLAMDVIEFAAQKHDRVLVRFLPGNHDPDAAIALTVALSVFYAGNPRVTIDDNPSLIFYHRFGRVLLGATHGHTMKPERMAMMMANDCPEDWGMTAFRHIFFGHIHHESAKEIGSVRCESFNTPAAKDAHAHGGGYRSGQSLNAVTFHRELGEVGRHRVNLIPSTMRLAA